MSVSCDVFMYACAHVSMCKLSFGFLGFQVTPILTKFSTCEFIGVLFGYHRMMLGNKMKPRHLKEARKQIRYKCSLRKTRLGSALLLE